MKSFKEFKKKNQKKIIDMYIHFKMNEGLKGAKHSKELEDNETYINFKHPHRTFKEENEIDDTHNRWLTTFDNSHIGSSINEVSRHLDKNRFKSPNYTKRNNDHKNALINYTSDSSDLNKKLVSNTPLRSKEQEQLHHLDEVANETALDHHYLYSGLGKTRAQQIKEAAESGSELRLPAYTSLTLSKPVAYDFAQNHSYFNKSGEVVPKDQREYHYLSLLVKKGQKAAHIAPWSVHDHEYESILPRNTKLKIHPTPTVNTDSTGAKHHIWHAEISHQD